MKVKGNNLKNLESDKYRCRKQIGEKSDFSWQCKWMLFTNTTGILVIPLRGFDVYNNDKIIWQTFFTVPFNGPDMEIPGHMIMTLNECRLIWRFKYSQVVCLLKRFNFDEKAG